MIREVLIADPEDANAVITWAVSNCKSYIDHQLVDVSDTSYTMDVILSVRFSDEKDAVMFSLKWK